MLLLHATAGVLPYAKDKPVIHALRFSVHDQNAANSMPRGGALDLGGLGFADRLANTGIFPPHHVPAWSSCSKEVRSMHTNLLERTCVNGVLLHTYISLDL